MAVDVARGGSGRHRVNARLRPVASEPVSRVLIGYLVFYLALVIGAAVTLWRSGLVAHLDRGWTIMTIVAALALGGVLALLSRK